MCWFTEESGKTRKILDRIDPDSDPDDPLGSKLKDPYSKDMDWDHFLKMADGTETHYSTASGDMKVFGKKGAQSTSKLGKFAAQTLPTIGAGDLRKRETFDIRGSIPTIPTNKVR